MVEDAWNRLRRAGRPAQHNGAAGRRRPGPLFLALFLTERLVGAPLPAARLPIALAGGVAIAAGLALRRRTPLAAVRKENRSILCSASTSRRAVWC